MAPRGRAEPRDNDVRSNFEDSNIEYSIFECRILYNQYSAWKAKIEIETETDTDTNTDVDIDIDKNRIFEFSKKFEFSSTRVLQYSNIEYRIFDIQMSYTLYSIFGIEIENRNRNRNRYRNQYRRQYRYRYR